MAKILYQAIEQIIPNLEPMATNEHSVHKRESVQVWLRSKFKRFGGQPAGDLQAQTFERLPPYSVQTFVSPKQTEPMSRNACDTSRIVSNII